MDNARIFISLRPGAVFAGESVNFHSLETIARTYSGNDMPTPGEMDAEEVRLNAQDNDADYQNTLKADIEQRFDPTLKAAVLSIFDEINTLRTRSGLIARTIDQLKTAIKNKL